jgi:hypothetical protein
MSHVSVEVLSAYLDRELPDDHRERLERHLEQCPRCRERLASLRGVVRRLRLLERTATPLPLDVAVARQVSLVRESERARSLGEQLRVRSLEPGQQSSLFLAFSLVVALVAITNLFVSGSEQLEHSREPVVMVVEASQARPLEVEIDGRRFRREGDRFRQVEVARDRGPQAVVAADSELGRELIASTPDLALLLEERRAVLLEAADGRVVELRRGVGPVADPS